MLDAPTADTIEGLRDRALLSVGLRRAEIAALKVSNIPAYRGGGPYQAPFPCPWRTSSPRLTSSPSRVFTVGRGAPVSFLASPVVMRPIRRTSSRIFKASGCKPSACGSRAIFSASRSFCFFSERRKNNNHGAKSGSSCVSVLSHQIESTLWEREGIAITIFFNATL
jgi:hypothetical protein